MREGGRYGHLRCRLTRSLGTCGRVSPLGQGEMGFQVRKGEVQRGRYYIGR